MNKAKQEVVNAAIAILDTELKEKSSAFENPQMVKDFIRLNIEQNEYEAFVAMFLDAKHRLIEYRELFRGSITSASVPVREVVKAALYANAASMIVAHNHPSGDSTPSAADKSLTETLYLALGMIEVKLLDHLVVGAGEITSFAELGAL